MSKEKCIGCRFFKPTPDIELLGDGVFGLCCRNPPVQILDNSQEDEESKREREEMNGSTRLRSKILREVAHSWRWPLVGGEDWCGEFKARDEDGRVWTITINGAPPGTTVQNVDGVVNVFTAAVVEAIESRAGSIWKAMHSDDVGNNPIGSGPST